MNSIFTEENLLAFTTAARFGSFSKAAEELGLTTSAISYTIKRMETGLDVVLFTHSTRSIELTESGRYFFRKATDLLNDFHAIKRSIDTISQGIEARVRICINQLLYTPKHTARLLQVLKKQFPTCQITVTTEVYNGVWDAIINNQANIAIGAPDTLLDGGGIDYTEIGAIRWAFAIAPDHPLAFVPEPSPKANCVSTLILWWRTPRIRLIKKWAGCCTGRSQFWCQISTPNVSARF
ncbi:LysR family transcriptional regulator [Escherichia coli]|uniref:HTH lysR-type domain-containing protein n=1 Tax=Escherichia coli TaxID=562 RepID=C3TNB5_ECOLX|nr:hypothetical protein ECs0365 [Escherichia coli]EHV29360.1 bacterial regulatory helix-turn-helix, lysR family protein [Escherichia coli DEC5A]EHV44593.1 bacterial regulatory helix-turn-helix, lysR family protein [Escherichia coli DEC5D]EHV45230.1 bacterial regulatory helix-turn-helix, lysR family protein [Escherichia coli DEC5C]EHV51614.1 bacterial regulatory helix-turn-helix, lysR family protein [Escherichia coli DEC5E]